MICEERGWGGSRLRIRDNGFISSIMLLLIIVSRLPVKSKTRTKGVGGRGKKACFFHCERP
jgi:hypothetical protein